MRAAAAFAALLASALLFGSGASAQNLMPGGGATPQPFGAPAAPPAPPPGEPAGAPSTGPGRPGDAGLTRDQYIQRAQERAGRAAATRFDQMDINHDGVLTRDEIRAYRSQHPRGRGGRGGAPAEGEAQ